MLWEKNQKKIHLFKSQIVVDNDNDNITPQISHEITTVIFTQMLELRNLGCVDETVFLKNVQPLHVYSKQEHSATSTLFLIKLQKHMTL